MTVPGAPDRPAFCTSCGAPASGASFCTACGTRLLPDAVDDTATQVVPRPVEQEPQEPQEPHDLEAAAPTWFDEAAEPAPADVAYADGVAAPPAWGEDPTAPRRSRRGLVLTAAFLALVLLGVAGFFGYQYVRDGEVRTALAASTEEYNAVVEELSAADDVAAISTGARRAQAAAAVVQDERDRIAGADTPRGKAVEAQLEAEHEVLTAAAALATLRDDPLQTWGDAHRELRSAVSEERDTRERLAELDEGSAGRIADGDRMLGALTATVGSALAEDAAGGAVAVLDRVAAAEKTAQLREVAGDALSQQDAVASVARALDRDNGREVLTAYGEVLAALGGLSELSASDASVWTDVRAAVGTAADELASAAGPSGAQVRTALAAALQAGDAVVVRAERGYADWVLARDEAESALADDRAALDGYEQEVAAQMEAYATGREALGDFTDALDAGTADAFEASSVFGSAVGERESIAFVLREATVPEGVGPQHDALLALVERGTGAVTAAYEGVSEATSCFDDCPDYRSTAGWRTFLTESEAISKQYAPVLAAWQKSVAAARSALDGRPLPTEPDL